MEWSFPNWVRAVTSTCSSRLLMILCCCFFSIFNAQWNILFYTTKYLGCMVIVSSQWPRINYKWSIINVHFYQVEDAKFDSIFYNYMLPGINNQRFQVIWNILLINVDPTVKSSHRICPNTSTPLYRQSPP